MIRHNNLFLGLRTLGTVAATCGGLAALTHAQAPVTFSIADPGATIFAADCAGNPISGATILTPATAGGVPVLGAPTPPCIVIGQGGAGLNLFGGAPHIEVDALSYGADARLPLKPAPGRVWFSVDERARGFVLPPMYAPSVRSEAACTEQAASTFINVRLPILPRHWVAGAGRNVQAFDGNPLPSCTMHTTPGLGVLQPFLVGGAIVGDDVDTLDIGAPTNLVLFSLDSNFADPCGGVSGWGSAMANGFSPAAVLRAQVGVGPPGVWIPGPALGLDIFGWATDDLDALAVWDNGNHQYDSCDVPFGWIGGAGDMVLFSVRRGSAVIGQPDSLFGDPIEEGDVLMPPLPGGMSPFPAIIIPAEFLGLATRRSGTAAFCGNVRYADDLDALDVLRQPVFDCNGNGREDALDIYKAFSLDVNGNGIPDECE